MYRFNAPTITAETVEPSSAALTFAASHTSSGTRTVRSGMRSAIEFGEHRGALGVIGDEEVRPEHVDNMRVVGALRAAGLVPVVTDERSVSVGTEHGGHYVSLIGIYRPYDTGIYPVKRHNRSLATTDNGGTK